MRESPEGQLEVTQTWTETERTLLLHEANSSGLDHLCRMLTLHSGQNVDLKSIPAERDFANVTDAISQGWNVVNCNYALPSGYNVTGEYQGSWVFLLSRSSQCDHNMLS